jgi:hypothetical protein
MEHRNARYADLSASQDAAITKAVFSGFMDPFKSASGKKKASERYLSLPSIRQSQASTQPTAVNQFAEQNSKKWREFEIITKSVEFKTIEQAVTRRAPIDAFRIQVD